MDNDSIRLECLRLALSYGGDISGKEKFDIAVVAESFYAFVTKGT